GQLDMLITNIPEVELTVGKLGRVESALDPAPISMFENIINYQPEYATDEDGRRQRFRVDDRGNFILATGDTLNNDDALLSGVGSTELIPDKSGMYFRNWRSHIHSPDDIWNEIVKTTRIPGVTSAPKLQPIETRLIMLQTGMRAPMGIKVFGQELNTIQAFGFELEEILKIVPYVKSQAVFADRIVGKPYMQLVIDREQIARFGLTISDVQQTIETAVGGMEITSTVEGRERFPVRVRYPRELRDDPEALEQILISTPTGVQIPLGQLVDVQYERGPQAIKSEGTFLVGYVLFDKRDGFAEVDVINNAQQAIRERIDSGDLQVPSGISYQFSGSYENQVRAEARLAIIVPVVLFIVLLILYFQFNSLSTSLMVFSGIAMAFSGGFLMIWFYGQEWFADFSVFGTNFRDLFQMHTINLSVAVWVGFIALFGIATDDGVLIATYLDQSFKRNKPQTVEGVHKAVIEAGLRRVRPALMTVSTTMIALLPVLSSTGRGADIMIPMAIPTFGGMAFALVSIFIVPVLYGMREEWLVKKTNQENK
ncbi:MAG: efflux RND transporter permease subunit, partial [Cyclobacteriaceae bacterium]